MENGSKVNRFLTSVILLLMFSNPALAWKKSNAAFESYDCQGKYKKNRTTCLSAKTRHIRSDSGTLEVRLIHHRAKNIKELRALFAAQGLDDSSVMTVASQMRIPEKLVTEKLSVYGLTTEDGKREILPAIYFRVYPISDKRILVQRFDRSFGLINLDESLIPKPTDIKVGYAYEDVIESYDEVPQLKDIPLTFLFRSQAPNGYMRYSMISPVDGSLTVIDNIVGGTSTTQIQHSVAAIRNTSRKDYFVFGPKFIGFNVKSNTNVPVHTPEINDADALVVLNIETGFIERMDNPMQWIVTPNDTNGYLTKWIAMYQAGKLPGDLQLSGQALLLPYDQSGYPQSISFRDEALIGMIPITGDVGSNYWKDGWVAAKFWALAFTNNTQTRFRLIEDAGFDVSTFSFSEGSVDNRLINLASMADIWVGLTDSEKVKSILGPASEYTNFPERYFAVRGLRQSELRMRNGVASLGAPFETKDEEWIGFKIRPSLNGYASVTSQMEGPAYYFQNSFPRLSPLEAANYADAAKVVDWERNNPAARQRRALEEMQAKYDGYIAYARETMSQQGSARGDATFAKAAKVAGGDILAYFFSANQDRTNIGYAEDICFGFGNNSRECAIVQPWMDIKHATEEAARQLELERNTSRAAADAVARQRAMTRPSYTGPKKPEIKYCWRQNGFWNC